MANFLDINQVKKQDLNEIIDLGIKLKTRKKEQGQIWLPLSGKHLAMIFEKPSTRTRTSFEVGINQLGGHAIIINTENSQLGRGETPEDTAKVLSRYVDIIMIRCFKHSMLLELAEHSTVPVINGLTDFSHPCQVMADIMTYIEHRGSIRGKKITWLGDGNNMVNSWIHAAIQFDFNLHIATPKDLAPCSKTLSWANKLANNVTLTDNPELAASDADLITTDTWISMGNDNADIRRKLLANFQVNKNIMNLAKNDAIFMHCLPAHRGEEVTDEVIDGDQSVVFDEAENRLHIQKAIMIWCLKNT